MLKKLDAILVGLLIVGVVVSFFGGLAILMTVLSPSSPIWIVLLTIVSSVLIPVLLGVLAINISVDEPFKKRHRDNERMKEHEERVSLRMKENFMREIQSKE